LEYPVILQRLLDFLRGSGIFVDGLLDPHVERFEQIREAYHWDAAAEVSSHNDPNPRNVIFDGQRLWLIDWESAYRNDPLTDVAILIDGFARSPRLEERLVSGWLGRPANALLRARLVLMRALTRLYYAGITLRLAAGSGELTPQGDLVALSEADFSAAVAQGKLTVGSADMMCELGKMFLAAFLARTTAPGFADALAVAQGG
jgi:hypothetical protein